MAYAPIKTEDLKKQIMAGKKHVMSLAFNPGPKGADLLIIDRLKAPDVIGRVAKKEGIGSKVAYGSFVIDARKFRLTAEQEMPGLAKRLRKYLKTLDYSFVIEVCDENGNFIEEADASADDIELDAVSDVAAPDPEPETAPFPDPARAALTDRLRTLQPSVAAFGGSRGQLGMAIVKVVAAVKSGDHTKADQMLTQIEGAVSKAEAKQRDTPAESAQPNPKALMARAASLKGVLDTLPSDASQVIKKAIVQAVTLLQARDFTAAETKISAAERAVNALAKQRVPPEQAAPAAIPTPNQTALPNSPQEKQWQGTLATAEQKVAAATKSGKGDPDALARALAFAKSRAADGKFDDAHAAANSLDALINEPTLAPHTGEPEAPALTPEAAAACARSRQEWINTRNAIKADLVRLKMVIDTQTRDISGLEDVAGKTNVLLDHFSGIDSTLEGILAALLDTQDSVERQSLKHKAAQTVSTYRATLDTDFFRAVDDNGFAQTTIRANALAALAQVDSALNT